eukprot:scaffold3913_cov177-Skeletonema_marinoi.AAC.2
MTPKKRLFLSFAIASRDKLDHFYARGLSNLHIATQAARYVAEFNAQDMSNMMWAYATVDKPHALLFEAIAALEHLGEFNPQNLANIVWAYATAGMAPVRGWPIVLLELVSCMDSTHNFLLIQCVHLQRLALSNTLWAYAKTGFNHPELFDKWPITLLNLTKWIGSTLKTTARFPHPELFKKAAILLWSYAKMGDINKQLFLSFVSTAAELIDSCNNQHLADISGRMQ